MCDHCQLKTVLEHPIYRLGRRVQLFGSVVYQCELLILFVHARNRFGVIGRITNWIRICQKWHNSSNFSMQQPLETQRKQMETLVAAILVGGSGLSTNSIPTSKTAVVSIPSFIPFDSSLELWLDNRARFQTFTGANSVLLIRQPRFSSQTSPESPTSCYSISRHSSPRQRT